MFDQVRREKKVYIRSVDFENKWLSIIDHWLSIIDYECLSGDLSQRNGTEL